MVYGQDDNTNVSMTHTIMVLNRINRMANAEEKGDYEAYFVNFKWLFDLLITYVPSEAKAEIQLDWQDLKKYLELVEEAPATEINPQSKKEMVTKVQKAFIDAHLFYLMQALSKTGVIRNSDEGVIDFDKTNFETVKRIIRAGQGLPTAIANSGLLDQKKAEV